MYVAILHVESTSYLVYQPQQRGIKRKSDVGDTLPPSEVVPELKPSTKSEPATTTRVKKGVVLSDDDEDSDAAPKIKNVSKGKARNSVLNDPEAERSLRAMMDVDDCEHSPNRPLTLR